MASCYYYNAAQAVKQWVRPCLRSSPLQDSYIGVESLSSPQWQKNSQMEDEGRWRRRAYWCEIFWLDRFHSLGNWARVLESITVQTYHTPALGLTRRFGLEKRTPPCWPELRLGPIHTISRQSPVQFSPTSCSCALRRFAPLDLRWASLVGISFDTCANPSAVWLPWKKRFLSLRMHRICKVALHPATLTFIEIFSHIYSCIQGFILLHNFRPF